MGDVLQLRPVSRRLGYDDVMLVPRETNTTAARDVLAYPQNYSDSVLRDACLWLRDNGDWMDQERARHLLKALYRQARLKAADDAWWAREKRELRIIGLIILAVIVSISLFDAAWGRILAAGIAR
jgi:hypothetical protein